jgi:hypothetical protein
LAALLGCAAAGDGNSRQERDQHRTERIVPHLLRNRLRAITEGIAAYLISVLGVADGGICSFARRILGVAIQVLRRACRLADPAARVLASSATSPTVLSTLPAKSFAEPEVIGAPSE